MNLRRFCYEEGQDKTFLIVYCSLFNLILDLLIVAFIYVFQ